MPGPRLEDALSWVPRLQAQGMGVTLGYFNADAEPRQSVLAADLAAVEESKEFKGKQLGLEGQWKDCKRVEM